jgi:hypothetical protein
MVGAVLSTDSDRSCCLVMTSASTYGYKWLQAKGGLVAGNPSDTAGSRKGETADFGFGETHIRHHPHEIGTSAFVSSSGWDLARLTRLLQCPPVGPPA